MGLGRLQDKVIVISGAARGQGAAEAKLFSEEGARNGVIWPRIRLD